MNLGHKTHPNPGVLCFVPDVRVAFGGLRRSVFARALLVFPSGLKICRSGGLRHAQPGVASKWTWELWQNGDPFYLGCC